MKYAREVIDLLGAHRGREFKMGEIVRYCCGNVTGKERNAARRMVALVLDQLIASGSVKRYCTSKTNCLYFM